MKKFLIISLIISLTVLQSSVFAVWELDPDFGDSGILFYSGYAQSKVYDMCIQNDGKILVTGVVSSGNNDMVLVRINKQGSLDPDFGASGIVTQDNAAGGEGYDDGRALVVQPDNKIVVVGSSHSIVNRDIAVWRFDPTGNLDTEFGEGDGVFAHNSADGYGADYAYDAALQQDGKIVFTGTVADNGIDMLVWRILSNGASDPDFNNGYVTFNNSAGGNGIDCGYGIAVQNDGKLVIAGYSQNSNSDFDMVVWRLTAAGTLDTEFGGGDGIFTHNNAAGGNNDDVANAVVIQDDGKIVVTGYSINSSGSSSMVVWRLTEDGILDSSFGGGAGFFLTDTEPGVDESGQGLTLSENRIIVTGYKTAGQKSMSIWRITDSGFSDTTFGTNGVFEFYDTSLGNNSPEAVVVQNDGKILAAGYSDSETSSFFTLWRIYDRYVYYPPQLQNVPDTVIYEKLNFIYQINANDTNNDKLIYSLDNSPASMNIDTGSGIITWATGQDDVGINTVVINVTDNIDTVYDTFIITVINVQDTPYINSIPDTYIYENSNFSYMISASDTDGDTLYYMLVSSSVNIICDTLTGLLEWTASQIDIGQGTVVISVSDNIDTVYDTFIITVLNQQDTPVLNSIPDTVINERENFILRITGSDTDGDSLYYFIKDEPSGMEIDSSGLITWQPAGCDSLSYNIIAGISDDKDTVTDSFTVNIIFNYPDTVYLSSPDDNTETYIKTIHFNWAEPADTFNEIIYYKIDIASDSEFNIILFSDTTENTDYSSSSIPDSVYYWRVTAVNIFQRYSGYNTRKFDLNSTPLKVSLVSPEDMKLLNDSTPEFSWNGNADTYYFKISEDSGFTSEIYNVTSTNTSYSVSDTKLSSGTYYWVVTGINRYGNSNVNTAYRKLYIDIEPPVVILEAPPSDTVYYDSIIVFNWSGDGDTYLFELSKNSDFSTLTYSLLTDDTGFTHEITPGTYYWRVTGYDDAGNTSLNSGYRTLNYTKLPVVTSLSPEPNYTTEDINIIFTWTADGDYVYLETASNPEFTSAKQNINVTGLSSYQIVFSPGTYYWRLITNNIDGASSGYTETRSFSIVPPAIPKVTGITYEVKKNGDVILKWTEVSTKFLAGYIIYYDTAQKLTGNNYFTTSDTELTIIDFDFHFTYNIIITAFDDWNNEGIYSDTVSIVLILPNDFNLDGKVNDMDLKMLKSKWYLSPSQPGWEEKYNLYKSIPERIDAMDLFTFMANSDRGD